MIMRKQYMSSLVAAVSLTAACLLASCDNRKFSVEGAVAGAKDSTLYLENMSLDGPVVVDSAKLGQDGEFRFTGEAPEAPEFYRLRIHDQIINLSVDSTETITVKATYPAMATNYVVEGSAECATIRELALKQIDLQARVRAVSMDASLAAETARDSIMSMVEAYKDVVKREYIYKAPMRASSYFALFQAIGGMLIFNPRESAEDIKAFAAVATSWDTYHPDAVRGKNLHNIALEGMKNIRAMRNKIAKSQISADKLVVSDLIDVALVDNKGNLRRLSDLGGKVVMLDFHVFAHRESPARIMKLRELYDKYHGRGFEIYQVSLDADEHFWKTQTAALPWISVRDPLGVDSEALASYNVGAIPTFFLIDRNNAISKRDAQIKDLDAEIERLLR